MDFNFIAERVKLSLTSPKELVKKAVKDDFNNVLVYFLVIALPAAVQLLFFKGKTLLEPIEMLVSIPPSLLGGIFTYLISLPLMNIITSLNLFIGGAWIALLYDFITYESNVAFGAVGAMALYGVTLLNLFIGGAWLHLWVYVLGGKQGIKQTWKAMIYASTPSLLLGWIPFINIFTGLWSFILTLLFIGDMQKIGWPKTLLAIVLAGEIPILCSLATLLWMLSYFIY